MTATVFVDTNVLIHARDASERDRQPMAHRWLDALWENRLGRLSYQVLQEYYVTVTRKPRPGLAPDDARADVRDLLAWRPARIDQPMLEDAWWLESRFALSFWDALIVASARALGSRYLLTQDLQAGQDLDGLLVVDLFQATPEELGLR